MLYTYGGYRGDPWGIYPCDEQLCVVEGGGFMVRWGVCRSCRGFKDISKLRVTLGPRSCGDLRLIV